MKINLKIFLVFFILTCFSFLIFLKIFDLQILRGQFFLTLAQNNQFYTLPVEAQRGVILDHLGQPLVLNQKKYFLVNNPDILYSDLVEIDKNQALNYLATNSAKVLFKNQRQYLYPSLSHVLGYLRDEHGVAGLEKFYDQNLKGLDGQRVYEIRADLKKNKLISTQDAQAGLDIQTSLDGQLSDFILKTLENNTAAVIVSDAQTGQILTLVSSPDFDNNLFTDAKNNSQQIQDLLTNAKQPLFNRAISGTYPLGSVFKLVTALAGLETDSIDQDTLVLDEGVIKIDDFEFRSWFYWSHGRTEGELNLVKAIQRSNDIYFYKAAEWTGVENLVSMAKQLGFNQATGIDLENEKTGLVPDPAWKEQVIGEKWYLGNTYHLGIGQGDLLVTPMQVNQLVQALANQGQMCRPSLLLQDEPECKNIGIKDQNLNLVLEGMIRACNPGGTASIFAPRNQQLYNPANTVSQNLHKGVVACKTGTAEFGPRDENGWRATHGWWVGIVEPRQNFQAQSLENLGGQARDFPQRIVITILAESDENEKFREGSRFAALVGKKIIDWIEGERL